MPKPTQLHAKGKPKTLQKPCHSVEDILDKDPEEAAKQFQLELCWCIQELEKTLSENKADQKHLQESWKVLTVLKNNNQPVIRKRQLMRIHFGDYRAKMAVEEKKLAKMASKIKISDSTEAKSKATFLRKSIFLSNNDKPFKFGFQTSSDKTQKDDTNKNGISSNGDGGNSEKKEKSDKDDVSSSQEICKDFKFVLSKSDFKFNFSNDNEGIILG